MAQNTAPAPKQGTAESDKVPPGPPHKGGQEEDKKTGQAPIKDAKTRITEVQEGLKDFDALISAALRNATQALTKHMSYDEKVDTRIPFSVVKNKDDKAILLLPLNLDEVLAHPIMGPLTFFLIEKWGPLLATSDLKIELSEKSEHERLFFLGLINRLNAPFPGTGYKFTTDKKAPQKKGRACADAELFLAHGNMNFARFEYLPPSVKIGKSKLLSSMFYDLLGMKQQNVAAGMMAQIARIAKEKNKNDSNAAKAFGEFLVPVGVVVETIVRKKVIEVRKNGQVIKESTPIHVGKPSSFAEVLTSIERDYLKKKELPWDDIHTLTTVYHKGIPVDKIEEFSSAYKKAYEKTFEIANKLNSWRAIRRKKFADFLPKGKKARAFKSTDAEGFFQWLVEPEDDSKSPSFDTQNIDLMNFAHLKACFDESFIYGQFTKGSSLNTPGVMFKIEKALPPGEFIEFLKYVGWIPLGKFSDYIGYLADTPFNGGSGSGSGSSSSGS